MKVGSLILALVAVCCASAVQPPIRLKSIIALENKIICSLENTKTRKRHWVRVNEVLPELEGYVVTHIDAKKRWIELNKQDKVYIVAISGVFLGNERREMSIEESGLSSLIQVYENRNRR